jgi:hypothetical protein
VGSALAVSQPIDRPILMSGPLVVKTLADLKTQTRRLVQSPARNMQRAGDQVISYRPPGDRWYGDHVWSMRDREGVWGDYTHEEFLAFCPYGQPGDRLWVRETFYCDHAFAGDHAGTCSGCVRCTHTDADRVAQWREELYFRADDPPSFEDGPIVWRPSIFMSRWASRLTLEIAEVRVERLQDLSEEDAKAEGVAPSEDEDQPWRCYSPTCERDGGCAGVKTARGSFETLWDSINGDRPGASWAANPWTWALTFRRVEVRS